MAIRMTGLISGMDTESIIKQLVDAQKIKNKRTTDKRDLLTFEQEKWKDLNTKLLKLYTDDLSKMRFQSNYMAKQVTSSNEDIITAIANGTSAPEGTHTIEVTQTSGPQYVTGMTLKDADGKIPSGSTKLTTLGISATTIFTIETKDGKKNFEIDENTTLDGFAAQLRDNGLSANYDATQGRFFIGSKTSGADSYFSMTTTNDPSIADRKKIHEIVGYGQIGEENQKKVDAAYIALRGTDATAKNNAIDLLNGFAKDRVAATAENIATDKALSEVKDAIRNGTTYAGQNYSGLYDGLEDSMKIELRRIHDDPALDFDNPQYKKELETMVDSEISKRAIGDVIGSKDAPISSGMETVLNQKKADIIANGTTITSTGADGSITTTNIKKESEVLAELAVNINNYMAGSATSMTGELGKLGLTEVTTSTDTEGKVTTSVADSKVTLTEAKSSEIKYNGTTFASDTNVINVNGLTITIKGETKGEKISLNVSNNSQNTYDMIKGFVKSYNSILAEMNTLYYAKAAKGYAPLSEDERAAMSDDQVKKWEGKIKESILRRDDSVSSILSTMKTATGLNVEVDGKKYSLASFGIQTSTDYTEKGLLHIFGDKEDSVYSAMDDKLMKAIKEDPDTVMKVFSEISGNLYKEMGEKCKGIQNVRSSQTFFNDKEMDTLQVNYKKQITILEKKLVSMENKYYKQFSAMESALAKMQSQTNALAGMLGN